ncbi:MAG TPA: DUF2530 domain-containing protein [Actinocrinis sp.]|jgi:hypothetical protein|uniref:DUF2530 domain-containing protein n=1 Tax=Actinocrinis sp. TaxID=1920516 RepID=UPI002DDD3DE3|nr:DUF2530 domain-containing protein [Actinocrinis sp.]HEV3174109.1 DUF2530 domain-containing protein [Actinocrinis sp.]
MSAPHDQESTSDGGADGVTPREIKPMEVDIFKIVVIGTVLYAIAFVVLLPFRTSLEHAGHGRWPWIALSGVVLGFMGLGITYRRARRR